MKPFPHQLKASASIIKKLKKHNVCMLVGEPRSGKTLSFIDATEKTFNRILIITTKKAMSDIQDAIIAYGAKKHFDVINYHSCQKLADNETYDCVILDECHNYITGYPKRSAIWKKVREFTQNIPVIYSSGTPTPEGYAGLFNMLALSDSSPWRDYLRFTEWFSKYGRPYTVRIGTINVNKYDRTHENKVKKCVKKLMIPITRKEAGHTVEAVDNLNHIPLSKKQAKVVKTLISDLYYEQGEFMIMADTPAGMMTKLRQIAGGVVKCDEEKLMYFKKNPKVDFINKNFNPDECIILAFFGAEQDMLSKLYPNVGSVTANAEGVDYSHFKHMIIYSMGHAYKTYEQVRARQLNMVKRKDEVVIQFLLSGIDEKVYNAVSNKSNFTSGWYKRNET